MATFRGPVKPSTRKPRPADGQLALPLPRAPRRQSGWVPGDPVHEPPEPVDPDPRPAVLADDDQPDDAATWHPDATIERAACPREVRRRSLVEDLLDP